jgi:alpha-tubulin suppressor-like RCC1 family protein
MEKSKVYEPQEIVALKNMRIQKVLAGATFTLFLTDKGELYGCGLNDLGQLGLDNQSEELQASLEKAKRGKHHNTTDVTYPKKVICFEGYQLSNLACGENHALASNSD